MRHQIGLGQHERDARPADAGPAVGQRHAKLHGQHQDIRTGLEPGRGPRVSGVRGRSPGSRRGPVGGGGGGGPRPSGFAFARGAEPRVRLAAGHHVLLAPVGTELQQLLPQSAGAHGPAALAAQVHRHGADAHRRGEPVASAAGAGRRRAQV